MRALLLAPLLLLACEKQPPTTTPPTGEEPVTEQPTTEEPTTEEPAGDRPKMTAAECETAGGKVVGDIGDGAIHKPDYKCPDSGEAPLGTITPEEGGPVAIEGSVCCK